VLRRGRLPRSGPVPALPEPARRLRSVRLVPRTSRTERRGGGCGRGRPAGRRPHCRSRLVGFDLSDWYRDHPERKAAGVAAAMAHALAVPVVLMRVAFVVATLFVFHIGPFVYGALW